MTRQGEADRGLHEQLRVLHDHPRFFRRQERSYQVVGDVDLHRDDVHTPQEELPDVLLVGGHFVDLEPAVLDRLVPLVAVRVPGSPADLPAFQVVDPRPVEGVVLEVKEPLVDCQTGLLR